MVDSGQAPEEYVSSVHAVESERVERRARLESARSQLYDAVPRLADGIQVQWMPVLAEGEFEWGYVLFTESQPEGVPVSGLVAKMVSLIDRHTQVIELLARMREGVDEAQAAQVERGVVAALQILYVDGTISDLLGL